jgi:dipeptidyl aminopeptidase/acylaminoacyl peptidase
MLMLARRMRPLTLLLVALPLAAQAPKPALTQVDWDRWESIAGAALSTDGRWVGYTLRPQVGDGTYIVRSTSGPTEYRIGLGYIAKPNNTPGGARGGGGGGGEGEESAPAAGSAALVPGGAYVVAVTQATQAETEAADRAKARIRKARAAKDSVDPAWAADTMPRGGMVLLALATGERTEFPRARNYRFPRDIATWMTYAPAPDSAADSTSRPSRGGGTAVPGIRRRTLGSTIVLRRLDTGAEERLESVSSHAFDDSARVLAYVVTAKDSTLDGVFLRDLRTGVTRPVVTGPGNYRAFTFDRAQQQFAFSTDRDAFGTPDAPMVIWHGTVRSGTAAPVLSSAQVPAGMRLPDAPSASFTRGGTALLVGIAPPKEDSIPADSLAGKAVFDLWHWQDPQLQPTQKLNVTRDRNRTYQAIYHLATRRLVLLASDSIPSVSLSDDAKTGVATSSTAYDIAKMWGDSGNDIYAVDPTTGRMTLIRQKITGSAQLSVNGTYVAFFDAGRWFTYAFATGKVTDLTGRIDNVRFDQETWSTPSDPSPWGIAGWTKGDRSILVYDRFDVWELDPAGVRPPVMVTDSMGRREQTTLRIIDLERNDERWIEPDATLLLRAFNTETKASGFVRDRLGVREAPTRIVMADAAHGTPQKARDAEMYLLTRGTFTEFPNLHVGPSLTALTRVTDANPFQRDYNWGTVELVSWRSDDGVPLQGLLFKPEDFDPRKQYPLISYFYERLSDGLHNYVPPTGRNIINATHYASNGYLVFMPDIHYEEGFPGPSAVKSIIPGVQMLLARGYVDPKGLGLQGQSWGGYQAAYIITQSTLFSAAMAGAPVANMTSAYGGIRWGSGLARAFQYEKQQSRIGQSLFEAPDLYILNSPLFHLERVTTPLFMMHNDMDDAVPWYQGIELYVGLRRLGKEVYLINYNNDVHNPASRANQKDMAMRMEQFFDTKLRGRPAPDWMVRGIPAKDKGKDQVVWTSAPVAQPVPATEGGNE